MNILKKSDMITLMPRGKIKKYMRLFEDFYKNNVSLGDRDKLIQSLNTEFAHHFTDKELPSDKIEYVTINNEIAFHIFSSSTRIFVRTYIPDRNGNIIHYENGTDKSKNIALSNFIYEYCNPEGLIILEKALMNYI